METADKQTSEIEKQQSNALGCGRNKGTDDQQIENTRGLPKSGLRNNRCGLCGGNYPRQGTCPAQGKKCLNCGKMNHFSKVCRGKPNNRSKSSHPKKTSRGKYHVRSADVEESPSREMSSLAGVDSDNSDEYTFNIGAQGHEAGKPIFQVTIKNTPIRIMAESGATVNILSKRDFDGRKSKPQLVETSAKVHPYMSDKPLTLSGKFRATVTSGSCSSVETFYVANGSSSSILSWTTSQALNLIKAVRTVEPFVSLPPDAPDFLKEFPNVTSGMGKYKGEPARIHVNESVKLMAQPHRQVPFHVRKQVEAKLKQLK
ncbi:uncharacterized protein [Montipora foliosa]|uniref:uncharacterized protein n=1 Tax=Montipora foliosa TaxID=591990 RepID=UPI0035F1B41D